MDNTELRHRCFIILVFLNEGSISIAIALKLITSQYAGVSAQQGGISNNMHCSHLEAYKDAKPVPTVCRT